MAKFRHHPDGIIYIDSLAMPLVFWLTQYPNYALPDGYISRYYEQGVRHVLSTGSTATPQPMPWAEGDAYIANVAQIQAAYDIWSDEDDTPSPADLRSMAARDTLMNVQWAPIRNAINNNAGWTAAQKTILKTLLRRIQLLVIAANWTTEDDPGDG